MLQFEIDGWIFCEDSLYKSFQVIEDANSTEDTKKLLQFCSWENPTFSHTVLYELLWQIAFAYTHELRPYLQLLLAMLTLEDSWQHHR